MLKYLCTKIHSIQIINASSICFSPFLSLSVSMYVPLSIYIYIYVYVRMCMWVCFCVCFWVSSSAFGKIVSFEVAFVYFQLCPGDITLLSECHSASLPLLLGIKTIYTVVGCYVQNGLRLANITEQYWNAQEALKENFLSPFVAEHKCKPLV